jgi:predicted metal-dependent hydrolase
MQEYVKRKVKVSYHFRKSYELKIIENVIFLKVPHLTTESQINDLLKSKKVWIKNRLDVVKSTDYINDEKQVFLFGVKIDKPKGDLDKFYQQELSQYILTRINDISEQIGVKPSNLTIRKMTSRWGSCTSAKRITLNLTLAKAPKPVIDYVLTHELCHIKHMNHSLLFWNLVSKNCPEFREYKKWLKIHGGGLMER